MVEGVQKVPSSSDVLMSGSPKCVKCGISVPTAWCVKLTLHRNYRLVLELYESSHLIALLKVDMGSPFLVKFSIMEVFNIWAFLNSTEPVGPFRIIVSWIPALVWDMVIPPKIRTGSFNLGDLMEVFPSYDVVPSLPVRLMSPGFRKMRALLDAVSVMITFKVVVWCACKVPLQAATTSEIRGEIGVVMIRMVWLINKFFW